MEFILNLATKSAGQVWLTLVHNWPYLLASVLIAVLLQVYVDTAKVSAFLNRHRGSGVLTATAAAVATPLCSCGTTAVILGMMASKMPWAPIVAFMVASPLTSPEGVVYNAGLFGWPFALAFYLASIILGLAGGGVAMVLESRGWLANQVRLAGSANASVRGSEQTAIRRPWLRLRVPAYRGGEPAVACACAAAPAPAPTAACACSVAPTPVSVPACSCAEPAVRCGCGPIEAQQELMAGCGCGTADDKQAGPQKKKVTAATLLKELYSSSARLLLMFVGFAFVGYFLNGLIPASWVSALFGGGHVYNVPLAATLGLPLYINSEASLPLVRALLDNGMSQGAALAFLIAGAGTSIGAITGALTIARWRVVALVVGMLWVGAIVSGMIFNLLLALQVF